MWLPIFAVWGVGLAELVGNVLSNQRGGNVRFDVRRELRDDPKELGWVIRRAIRSPDFHWPHLTGKSKRAFRVRVSKKGLTVTNRLRYAYIINAGGMQTDSHRAKRQIAARGRIYQDFKSGRSLQPSLAKYRYTVEETIGKAIDKDVQRDTVLGAAGSFAEGFLQGVRQGLGGL